MGAIDHSGQRFGRLTVLDRLENDPSGSAVWRCVCDCGNERRIVGTALRAGRHRSCGCASPRFVSQRVTKHGMSRTRTYSIWLGMLSRCDPSRPNKKSHLYVDKGVRVCDRWQQFEAFLADMGEAPAGMSIDRIDGTKGYAPENCRWATPLQQANNTAANRRVECFGRTQTVAEWAREVGVKPNTLLYRLRRGAPPEKALREPVQRRSA